MKVLSFGFVCGLDHEGCDGSREDEERLLRHARFECCSCHRRPRLKAHQTQNKTRKNGDGDGQATTREGRKEEQGSSSAKEGPDHPQEEERQRRNGDDPHEKDKKEEFNVIELSLIVFLNRFLFF